MPPGLPEPEPVDHDDAEPNLIRGLLVAILPTAALWAMMAFGIWWMLSPA